MPKRFIWYEEALEFPNKPVFHIVGIEGRVEDNKLGIYVLMFGGGDVEAEYFSKIIDTKYGDLNAEAIQEQFLGKIARIKQAIGSDWLIWLQDFQKRLRQQTGKKVYYDFQLNGWYAAPSEPSEQPSVQPPVP